MNQMNRSIFFTGILCVLAAGAVYAQDIQAAGSERLPGIRRRALVLDISVRVYENETTVIWNETHQKTTIPGSPVNIQLRGSNVAIAVQFTPYLRRSGNVLVAQGQIWINDPQRGASYHTSIQTIPLEFNEQIIFFPLGTSDSSIEMILTVNPLAQNENMDESTGPENEH